MQEASRFLIFTRRLDALGIRYMIVGSVAAMIYGEPRLTNDVDLVVLLDQQQAARLPEMFPLSDFYCPPVEVIRQEMARARRGQFNIIHHDTGFKADFYLYGTDPLNAWGLQRARRVEYLGQQIYLAPPELVILRKLEFFRQGGSEKHLRDIRIMLTVSADKISLSELEEKICERGLERAWAEAQRVAT
ncbi:MAG: hypothetical protein ACRD6I_07960 [Candidatus Acidiferrales bacterium]